MNAHRPANPIPAPSDELWLLADAVCSGHASDADAARLNTLLESSPDAALFYAAYLDLHADLAWRRRGPLAPAFAPAAPAKPDLSPPRAKVRVPGVGNSVFVIRNSKFATAALLLLAAAAIAIYAFAFNPLPQAGEAQPETRNSKPDKPVATLIDATGTVIAGDEIANPGSEYAPGTYSIESGSAKFLLTSRVTVHLQGATRMIMHDDMAVSLTRGSAEFVCPTGAEGFTVNLPDGSRVVDRGTEFRVELSPDGVTTTRVIRGMVDVFDSTGALRRLQPNAALSMVDGRFFDVDPERFAAYDQAVLADKPVAYWKLDALDEGVRFEDSAGEHHATSSRPFKTVVDPAFGGEVLRITPGGLVSVATDFTRLDPFASTRRFALEGWLKPDANSGSGALFFNAQGDRRAGWSLMYVPGEHRGPGHLIFNQYGVGELRFDQVAIPVDRWSHLTLVCSSDRVTVYLDGKAIQSLTPAGKAPPLRSDFYVRLGAVNDAEDWSGSMARFAYYNVTLSDGQIQTHFAASPPMSAVRPSSSHSGVIR